MVSASPGLTEKFSNDAVSTRDIQEDYELTAEEISEAARYDPARANVYHLFTR